MYLKEITPAAPYYIDKSEFDEEEFIQIVEESVSQIDLRFKDDPRNPGINE
jgi:hypothetical protein